MLGVLRDETPGEACGPSPSIFVVLLGVLSVI
jgi:hypothetical protein